MSVDSVKCECGHINPEGTVLCEACGKPIEGNQHIDGNDEQKLLNMRYEGSARRSKTYNKSIVDKIWSFFSSVKVGVWLIILALIASAIGTIFPQEQYIPEEAVSRDPAIYYEATHGLLGKMFYQLGFHHLYSSWWYMVIIALIGVSLVICSIDRFAPLYKALKRQKAKRHKTFLSRQRLYSETENVTSDEKEKVKASLKKQRYKIREEKGHILAEKGRFSRWGPYVNHIGLIIILLAAILRLTPLLYTDDFQWVREGERVVLPSTDGEYYIENKKFHADLWDPDEADGRFKDALEKEGAVEKNFQTDAVVYKKKGDTIPGEEPDLEKVTEGEMSMNQPLKFSSYSLYQSGYQEDEFSSMTFNIPYNIEDQGEFSDLSFKVQTKEDDEEKDLGSFAIDLDDQKDSYKLDHGYKVEVGEYFPNFYIEDGKPKSKGDKARNPGFVLFVHPPDGGDPQATFASVEGNISATNDDLNIETDDYTLQNDDGEKVEKDLGEFKIDLTSPESEYKLDNGTRVVVDEYYPDLVEEDGKLQSESKYPKNPAFELSVYKPGSDDPEKSFVGVGKNDPKTEGNDYKLGLADYEMHDVSGIKVKKDHTIPYFVAGALIFLIGVAQGMYWQHRRIWIHPKDGSLLVAAHTNKNWFGLKKDIEKALDGTNINMVTDQQELEEEREKENDEDE